MAATVRVDESLARVEKRENYGDCVTFNSLYFWAQNDHTAGLTEC